jgi:hypothetical protein
MHTAMRPLNDDLFALNTKISDSAHTKQVVSTQPPHSTGAAVRCKSG